MNPDPAVSAVLRHGLERGFFTEAQVQAALTRSQEAGRPDALIWSLAGGLDEARKQELRQVYQQAQAQPLGQETITRPSDRVAKVQDGQETLAAPAASFRRSGGGDRTHADPLPSSAAAGQGHVASGGYSAVPAIPGYRVVRELGRGGMGVVFEAESERLGRSVAIKVLLTGKAKEVDVKRFRLEAESAASLNHPNIVRVHDLGQHQGNDYMVLEMIDGESAQEEVKRTGPMDPERAARVARDLARAVHYAHDAGILHRDLKPHNVLLQGDVPKLTDFGLAKLTESDGQSLTLSGTIVGTPAYMAPEQAAAERDRIDVRTDVYGLGATLFHMLTGRPPFEAESVHALIYMVMEEEVTSPREHVPEIDPALERICVRCLRKEPGDRYATAGELAEDLDRFLGGGEVAAKGIPAHVLLGRWLKRNRAVSLVVGFSLLVVAGVLGFAWYTVQEAERERLRALERAQSATPAAPAVPAPAPVEPPPPVAPPAPDPGPPPAPAREVERFGPAGTVRWEHPTGRGSSLRRLGPLLTWRDSGNGAGPLWVSRDLGDPVQGPDLSPVAWDEGGQRLVGVRNQNLVAWVPGEEPQVLASVSARTGALACVGERVVICEQKKGDWRIRAIDPTQMISTSLWQRALGGPVRAPPLTLDLDPRQEGSEVVVVATTTGRARAFNLADGRRMGSVALPGPVDTRLLPLREQGRGGEALVVAAARDGRLGLLRVGGSEGLAVVERLDLKVSLSGPPALTRGSDGEPTGLYLSTSLVEVLAVEPDLSAIRWAGRFVDGFQPWSGVAAVDLDADGAPELAVAEFFQRSKAKLARLVLYTAGGTRLQPLELEPGPGGVLHGQEPTLVGGTSGLRAWGPWTELPSEDGPPSVEERVAAQLLAGAWAEARSAAEGHPDGVELGAVAEWHLGQRGRLEELLRGDERRVFGAVDRVLRSRRPSMDVANRLLKPFRRGLSVEAKPLALSPMRAPPRGVAAAFEDAGKKAPRTFNVEAARIFGRQPRRGLHLGGDGFLELELELPSDGEYELEVRDKGLLNAGQLQSCVIVTLDEQPIAHYLPVTGWKEERVFELGKLDAGLHRLVLQTDRARTLYRLFSLRILPKKT